MSKEVTKRLAGCLLTILVLGGLIYFGFNLLIDGMCGNNPIASAISPDGRLKVVVFARNCGATTSFSTQVSVLAADGHLPNDGGNVFVCDSDHGLVPSGPGGGPSVSVKWTGSQHLSIRYPVKARTFAQNRQVAVKTDWFHKESVSVDYMTQGK